MKGHRDVTTVQGAALRGLNSVFPERRIRRRHYGFAVNQPFQDGIDAEQDAYVDSKAAVKMVRNRMEWMVKKVIQPCHSAGVPPPDASVGRRDHRDDNRYSVTDQQVARRSVANGLCGSVQL